jgi:hypothetical protein
VLVWFVIVFVSATQVCKQSAAGTLSRQERQFFFLLFKSPSGKKRCTSDQDLYMGFMCMPDSGRQPCGAGHLTRTTRTSRLGAQPFGVTSRAWKPSMTPFQGIPVLSLASLAFWTPYRSRCLRRVFRQQPQCTVWGQSELPFGA